MSAIEAAAEEAVEEMEAGGSVEPLREPFRAKLGSQVLEALEQLLGSLGAARLDPPAEEAIAAAVLDVDFVAKHLCRLGRGSSPTKAWPEDQVVARHAAELAYSVGRLAEQGLAALGLKRSDGGLERMGLRETFAIRFGETDPSLRRRHIELIVAQVFDAVDVSTILRPQPPLQSPLVRDLASAAGELRYLARFVRGLGASRAGVGGADDGERWREVVDRLPAQLDRLADQAQEGVHHA